jgi:DNA-binding NarL/FixJ family response regulator
MKRCTKCKMKDGLDSICTDCHRELKRKTQGGPRLRNGDFLRIEPLPPTQPTAREVQIVELLSLGIGQKAVADRLRISDRTVSAHLTHIFQKLGVCNTVHAFRVLVTKGRIVIPADPADDNKLLEKAA